MEYRKKAAIVIMLIFFFMLAAITLLYAGMRNAAGSDKAGTFDGGIMVDAVENGGEMI